MPGAAEIAPAMCADPGEVTRSLYPDGPVIGRLIRHNRHRICPFDRVAEHVPPGSRVLDIGCGAGMLIAHLAVSGRAIEAHGVDASENVIRVAQQMATRLKLSVPHAEVRFEHRPVQQGLPEGAFDAVCMVDVMHHIPPPAQEEAFRQAAARVRPGGLFIYKDMCDGPIWRSGLNRLHDLVLARDWIHYVPIELIERWAASEAFRLMHSEDINMLWYGHELRVFERPLTEHAGASA